MIVLYSLLIICYFLNLFIHSTFLSYVIGILALISLIFSLKSAKNLYKVVGIIFFVVGLFIFIYQQRSFTEVPLYMTTTVSLLAVFYVLPFINSIIIVGRYDQQVNKLLRVRIQHLGQLYYRSSFTAFLLGGFLNIATLPLLKTVIQKNLVGETQNIKNRFISQSLLRGYSLSLLISPMELLVVLSAEYTHVSYPVYLPWLILITIVLFILNWVIGFRSFKRYELPKDTSDHKTESQSATEIGINTRLSRKIFTLLLYLIGFMMTIVLVNRIFDMGFLQTVALIIIPFSFVWALSIRRLKSYIAYCLPLWRTRTLSLTDNMVLFLSVGFFTSNLNDSIFMDSIQKPFEYLTTTPVLLFVFIQILFIGLAMIGFHPLVTISILGGVLEPIIHSLNPVSVGLVLITSGLSTTIAGPFNLSVSLTANLLSINSYKVSFWNLGYALLMSSIGTIIAFILL
ncbi:hypothetical protein [Peribacillus loiseleuriae]|uniref:hypothetical protein n=1 Tax=Peribacillus loiseleuriae TaxID=1679170 RepID=UPI003CFC5331